MYDIIVLGGGPGGYLAAERAGDAGLSVLLIEKDKIGGVCLNEGCVPSKAFLYSAKIYENATHGQKYGISTEGAKLDQAVVVARKDKIVKKLVSGVKTSLKNSNVTIQDGFGQIYGRENGIFRVGVGEQIFEGRQLIIATGSEARIPKIPGIMEGLENGSIFTNREILNLTEIPESLVIIGGGVVGLEMADYFQTVGSQVTVIEMLDHIAGNADQELTSILMKNLEKKGIIFHLNSQVKEIRNNQVIFSQSGNETQTVHASVVLLSVGRYPVIEGFGLETLGIYTEHGRIVTDDHGLTNVPNVYAVGDVNGVWMLAHAAYREAEVAINKILNIKDRIQYRSMPSVIYTNPEMAFVGETEETATEKGLRFKKIVLPMNFSGRYMAENESGDGVIKLLIDSDYKCLIGCHLLGNHSSELILTAEVFIENMMSINTIKKFVFPHPTVGEIIREAIFHAYPAYTK